MISSSVFVDCASVLVEKKLKESSRTITCGIRRKLFIFNPFAVCSN